MLILLRCVKLITLLVSGCISMLLVGKLIRAIFCRYFGRNLGRMTGPSPVPGKTPTRARTAKVAPTIHGDGWPLRIWKGRPSRVGGTMQAVVALERCGTACSVFAKCIGEREPTNRR